MKRFLPLLLLLAAGALVLGVRAGLRWTAGPSPEGEESAVVLPATAGSSRPESAAGAPRMAMWVWDARIVLYPEAGKRLIEFSRRKGIDILYLSAYDLRPPMDRAYRAFNRQCHRSGIEVHALAGDPRWGKSRYHHIPLKWVRAVQALNAAAAPEERFDGLHTDVEVYLLAKSWQERPEVLLGGYLDLTRKIGQLLKAGSVPMAYGVDVPFWFDDDTAYRILWNGAVKAPSHHVLDIADTVTVMAYRNFAEGPDGTIRLVLLEMDYAERVGKQVLIGQETQRNLYPAYITFGTSSCEAMGREMEKIRSAFRDRASFGGFAVHHYESFRKLCGD